MILEASSLSFVLLMIIGLSAVLVYASSRALALVHRGSSKRNGRRDQSEELLQLLLLVDLLSPEPTDSASTPRESSREE